MFTDYIDKRGNQNNTETYKGTTTDPKFVMNPLMVESRETPNDRGKIVRFHNPKHQRTGQPRWWPWFWVLLLDSVNKGKSSEILRRLTSWVNGSVGWPPGGLHCIGLTHRACGWSRRQRRQCLQIGLSRRQALQARLRMRCVGALCSISKLLTVPRKCPPPSGYHVCTSDAFPWNATPPQENACNHA